ncbi:MAG TPA: hypothetical protein VFS40_16610 [Gemmatimonadales bacterium]|nr:hypothetical protein [Gemmatimonadales bacterium]
MSAMSAGYRRIAFALAAAGLVLAAPAHAQGRGNGKGHGKDHGRSEREYREYRERREYRDRRYVPMDRAVVVTREVLVERGYVVERVERVRDTQVIYYYRGNNGRGRGRGRLERMVIRPHGDVYVVDDAPSGVLVDLRVRLPL